MTTFDQIIQFLFSGLTTGAIYALIAIGFCIIHNSTGVVNFTQVDFVTLGGMVMYSFLNQAGLPMIAAFLLAIAAGHHCRRRLRTPGHPTGPQAREIIILIFITIGASHLIRGLIKILWGKNSMALPPLTGNKPFIILKAAVLPQKPVDHGYYGDHRDIFTLFLQKNPYRKGHPGRFVQFQSRTPGRNRCQSNGHDILCPGRSTGRTGRRTDHPHIHPDLRCGRHAGPSKVSPPPYWADTATSTGPWSAVSPSASSKPWAPVWCHPPIKDVIAFVILLLVLFARPGRYHGPHPNRTSLTMVVCVKSFFDVGGPFVKRSPPRPLQNFLSGRASRKIRKIFREARHC